MSSEVCEHGNKICSRCVVISDAAKRIADSVNLTLTAKSFDEIKRGYMAFALADGITDWVVYPTRNDAISHQSNEFLYMYLAMRNTFGGVNAKDMQLFLDMHRHAYDKGMRLTDPDAPALIPPLARGTGRWPK